MSALPLPKHAERLLALLAIIALFAFLGTRGLNEPDEGRYAELGREMVATGQWLVPHLNGFEHFQKPPLLYWFTATSLKLFGVNDWAARLPSALAALGTVALTYWIGRTLRGRAVGLVAALILVSSGEFVLMARLLTPDMLLTFCITAAIACLVQAKWGSGGVWKWGFFVAMGMGFLTKGPMALVVPCSTALVLQFAARRKEERFSLPWGRGLLISLALGLSWFVTLSITSHELFRYFWQYELVQRFASSSHGRSKPFWFFVPVILAGFLPWTLFLPGVVREAWTRLRQDFPGVPIQGLFLGWLIPPFVILSLSGSKLPTYVLPLLPGLALLLASWWVARGRSYRPVAICASVSVAIFVIAASQVPRFNDLLKQQATVRPLVETLKKQPDFAEATIFACNVRAHGLEFYLQHPVSATRDVSDIVLPTTPAQDARIFSSIDDCEDKMSKLPAAYGLVRPNDYRKKFPASEWRVVAKSGDFLLIGRLPTNPEAPAR